MKNNKKSDVKDKALYIFGHLNPDVDSICSTVAYGILKERLGYTNVYKARLGDLNKESRFALSYFDVEEPKYISDIRPQLAELHQFYDERVNMSNSIRDAVDMMKNTKRRLLPVVNDENKLEGIVTNSNVTRATDAFFAGGFIDFEILKDNLLKNLGRDSICGSYEYDKIKGTVYIDYTADLEKLKPQDIVIVTNYESAKKVLEKKVNLLYILPEPFDESVFKEYKEACFIRSSHSLIHTIHLVAQSISISSIMSSGSVEYFYADEYVDDVRRSVAASQFAAFPIVEKNSEVVGIVTSKELLDYDKKNVVLIDHNEMIQTIKDIKDANIVEIVDHHKIGNIAQTDEPPMIRIEPLGCTASIIYKLYNENNVAIDKKVAGLLLSAILSDTLILRSPTCTEEDKTIAKELAKIAGVGIEEYGLKLLESGIDIDEDNLEELITMDQKFFDIGTMKVSVSQYNVINYKKLLIIKDKIKRELENFKKRENADMVILLLTDIIENGSLILYAGSDKKLMYEAFSLPIDNDNIFVKDMVSRKKQVMPKLISSYGKIYNS